MFVLTIEYPDFYVNKDLHCSVRCFIYRKMAAHVSSQCWVHGRIAGEVKDVPAQEYEETKTVVFIMNLDLLMKTENDLCGVCSKRQGSKANV